MGFEHNELRHRALLARFMTGSLNWASRGDNCDALSDLCVCVCVCVCELNKIGTQSVNIFCTRVSFPSLPLHYY